MVGAVTIDVMSTDPKGFYFTPVLLPAGPNNPVVTRITLGLLRKEVIHPLLPERIPCYDLVLIADLTLEELLQ